MIDGLLSNGEFTKNLISSAVLFASLLAIRFIAVRAITTSKTIPNDHRRQWIVKARSLALLIFIAGLLVIWASELQNFAISLVAVAAAVVIALKELIMNVSGFFAQASAKPFGVGDRIEIAGIRGDVVDLNPFFTRVLEIGPGHLTNQYTGRAVNIPNSIFLSQNIINESFTEHFTLHVFTVPVHYNEHFQVVRKLLLEAAEQCCRPFIAEAKKVFSTFGQEQGIETPSVEPRVHIHFAAPEKVDLIVRIPAPISRKGRIEQDILNQFVGSAGKFLGVRSIEAPQ